MKVIEKGSWQFPSDLNVLDAVLSSYEQLNKPYIPKSAWLQCQLALAEAFTNAVRHAHQNCPSDVTVDIEITVFDRAVEIKIWDYGSPFDLEARVNKAADVVNDTVEGGRGLPILGQIADELSYRRTEDNRNCLILVKHYVAEPEVG